MDPVNALTYFQLLRILLVNKDEIAESMSTLLIIFGIAKSRGTCMHFLMTAKLT